MLTIVGVDPGGRYTGVVSKVGDDVRAACVLTRTTGDKLPDQRYLTEVIDEVSAQNEHADVIAVESLNEPTGQLRIINVMGLLGTAMVLGAVMARWPRAIVVPPGDNGKLPDVAYPEAIRRYRRLGGPTDHARSAYDVARVGELMSRALRTTMGGTR